MHDFWMLHGHQVITAIAAILLFGGRVHVRVERNGNGRAHLRMELWLAGNRYKYQGRRPRMQRKTEGDDA